MRFVQSAARVDQLPDSMIELALVGRSNVGKSSLLNAVANRKNLARTSRDPGATRLLNAFELTAHEGRWLIDLPGYGFAKVPAHVRDNWSRMIDGYLAERDQLAGVLLLIDGAVGPTDLDLQTLDWLGHHQLPVHFVATKSDKVKSSKRPKRRQDLVTKLGCEPADVRWVSATSGTGIAELRRDILTLLDAV